MTGPRRYLDDVNTREEYECDKAAAYKHLRMAVRSCEIDEGFSVELPCLMPLNTILVLFFTIELYIAYYGPCIAYVRDILLCFTSKNNEKSYKVCSVVVFDSIEKGKNPFKHSR